jgi:phage-related protein
MLTKIEERRPNLSFHRTVGCRRVSFYNAVLLKKALATCQLRHIIGQISKPLRWLSGEVKTPPMGREARREMGFLLRQLQEGENLSLPHSRPMPSIGKACHELRVNDRNKTWRLFYFLDSKAIAVLEMDEKKTRQTPKAKIEICKKRLKSYEETKSQNQKIKK